MLDDMGGYTGQPNDWTLYDAQVIVEVEETGYGTVNGMALAKDEESARQVMAMSFALYFPRWTRVGVGVKQHFGGPDESYLSPY
jgi:hypothetical protein